MKRKQGRPRRGIITEKSCYICLNKFPISHFYKSKNGIYEQFSSYCKVCYYESKKDKVREWRKKNPEKINLYSRETERKRVANLDDNYIKALLMKQFSFKRQEIPTNLIETKREQLTIKRLLKQGKREVQDGTFRTGNQGTTSIKQEIKK